MELLLFIAGIIATIIGTLIKVAYNAQRKRLEDHSASNEKAIAAMWRAIDKNTQALKEHRENETSHVNETLRRIIDTKLVNHYDKKCK